MPKFEMFKKFGRKEPTEKLEPEVEMLPIAKRDVVSKYSDIVMSSKQYGEIERDLRHRGVTPTKPQTGISCYKVTNLITGETGIKLDLLFDVEISDDSSLKGWKRDDPETRPCLDIETYFMEGRE